jgi:putative endonuclease
MKDNITYILKCADGSYYTGWTNDLPKRVQAHQSGRGGKYTRAKRPVCLVYYEVSETKEQAMSREWHIKRMTHRQKEQLIASLNDSARLALIAQCNGALDGSE